MHAERKGSWVFVVVVVVCVRWGEKKHLGKFTKKIPQNFAGFFFFNGNVLSVDVLLTNRGARGPTGNSRTVGQLISGSILLGGVSLKKFMRLPCPFEGGGGLSGMCWLLLLFPFSLSFEKARKYISSPSCPSCLLRFISYCC